MLKLLNSFSGVLESSYNPKQLKLYKCPDRVLENFAFGQMPSHWAFAWPTLLLKTINTCIDSLSSLLWVMLWLGLGYQLGGGANIVKEGEGYL